MGMKLQTKIHLTLLFFVLWIGSCIAVLYYGPAAFKICNYALGFGAIPLICLIGWGMAEYHIDNLRRAICSHIKPERSYASYADLADAMSLSFAVGRDRVAEQPQMAQMAIPPQMPISPGIEFLNAYQRNVISNQRAQALMSTQTVAPIPPQLPSLEDYHLALKEIDKLKGKIEEKEKEITALFIENYGLKHRTTNSIEGLDV
jgi:hypothetical protein